MSAEIIEVLVLALEEARLQLEYLDEKWPRGSTRGTLARINRALAMAEQAEGKSA